MVSASDPLDLDAVAGRVVRFSLLRTASLGSTRTESNSDFHAGADCGDGTVTPTPGMVVGYTSTGEVNGNLPLVGVYPDADGLATGLVGVVCFVAATSRVG